MKQHKPNPKLKTTWVDIAPKLKTTWVDIAPNFLRFRSNYFNVTMQNPQKNNLVFVESKADKEIYATAIKEDVDEKNIIPCEFSSTMNIEDFGRLYYYDKVAGDYKNCEFIKKISEEFEKKKHKEEYKNIDCFGLVDRDFNEGQSQCGNYEFTSCHDYETTLFYLYFPACYENNKDIINLDTFGKLLRFCTGQGILQKCSIDKKGSAIENALHYISHYNFDPDKISRNYKKRKDVIDVIKESDFLKFQAKSEYDFDKYIEKILDEKEEMFKNWSKKPYHIDTSDMEEYEGYKTAVRDMLNQFSAFDYCVEIKKWLKGEDNEIIIAFRLMNGHILFEKLKEEFGMDAENLLKEKATENVSLLKSENPILACLNYLKYSAD